MSHFKNEFSLRSQTQLTCSIQKKFIGNLQKLTLGIDDKEKKGGGTDWKKMCNRHFFFFVSVLQYKYITGETWNEIFPKKSVVVAIQLSNHATLYCVKAIELCNVDYKYTYMCICVFMLSEDKRGILKMPYFYQTTQESDQNDEQ
ncbi:hypothetical protein RFI_08223, partial [Reticulomyxa filosa]